MSLIWLVLLILYTLAIISHDVNDLAILEGGIDKTLPEANWIGNVGANIARAMLYLFGLAVYPMGFLLIVSVIRKFLPYPLKRQGYVSSFISVFVGIILLMAMWPANFQMICENLGIGRVMHPDMCLSGGTIGAAFAAPPVFDAGIQLDDFKYDLRRLISIAIIPIPSLISEYFNDDDLNNQYNLICKNFENVFK